MEGVKHYGVLVKLKDGASYTLPNQEDVEGFKKWLDAHAPHNAPHRVYELFYKDEQA